MAERRSVAADVVGSNPTSRPNHPPTSLRVPRVSRSPPLRVESAASLACADPASDPAAPRASSPAPPAGPTPPGSPASTPPSSPQRSFLELLRLPPHLGRGQLHLSRPAHRVHARGLARRHRRAFRFSFKAPQRITHFSRLATATPTSQQFVAALEPVRQAGKLGLAALPASAQLQGRPRPPRRLPRTARPPHPTRPAIAFEFRHELVRRSDLRPPPRPQRRPLHRRKRRPRHPRGPHRRHLRLLSPAPQRRLHRRRDRRLRRALHRTRRLSRDVFVYFKHEDEPTGALNAAALLDACAARSPPMSARPRCQHRRRRASPHSTRSTPTPSTRAASSRNGHLQTIVGNFLPRTNSLPPARARARRSLPRHRLPDRQPGPLPLPLAAADRPRRPPHRHHRARARRLLQLAVRRRQRQQALARRLQRHPHEHAQLRRHRARSPPRSTTPASPATSLAVMRFFVARERLQLHRPHRLLHGRQPRPQARRRTRRRRRRPQLRSVIGISPAIDLGPSADALHQPAQPHLRAPLPPRPAQAASAARPCSSPAPTTPTAPSASAPCATSTTASPPSTPASLGADDYYYRAAAARVLDRITVPTLILHALDDPFVRLTPETRAQHPRTTPHITLIETAHGGHCAFLAHARSRPPATTATGPRHTLLRFLLANS